MPRENTTEYKRKISSELGTGFRKMIASVGDGMTLLTRICEGFG